MAIVKKIEGDNLILTIDNGEKNGIKQAVEKWDLKDEESLVRFALAILLRADKISIEEGEEKYNVSPSKELKDQSDATTE